MRLVILTSIAAHPATAPRVLGLLVRHVLGGPTHYVGRSEMLAALAANPRTPKDATAALLREAHQQTFLPVMRRPGTTADDAIAWLQERLDTASLRHALRVVPDPGGTLARYAMVHAPGARIYQELLELADCPLEVRVAAAAALAARPSHTQTDKADIWKVVEAHPEHATTVRSGILNPALLEYLDEQGKLAASTPTPVHGTAAWLRDRSTPDAAVVAHLREHGDASDWLDTIRTRPDPAGTLVSAAFDVAHHDRTLTPRLLTAVLTHTAAPAHLKHAAMCAWPNGAKVPDRVAVVTAALLKDAPLEVVDSWAPHARTVSQIQVVLSRTDLTPAILDRLTDAVQPTYEQWSHSRVSMLDPLLWGVVLATHACSSPDQRADAQALTASGRVATLARPGNRQASHAALLVRLGQRLTHEEAAAVGRDIPVTMLNDHSIANLPTVTALVGAALEDDLRQMGDEQAAAALAALATNFSGTVGELFTTVRAVAG